MAWTDDEADAARDAFTWKWLCRARSIVLPDEGVLDAVWDGSPSLEEADRMAGGYLRLLDEACAALMARWTAEGLDEEDIMEKATAGAVLAEDSDLAEFEARWSGGR